MKASLLLCNGWSSVHLTLYCFSFLLLKLSTLLCPFCSARACRLLRQSCADCSRSAAKTAAGGAWLLFLRSLRWSATQSLWKPASCPTVIWTKPQPAERWFIGQFDDLYGNDHCGFSQSWLVAATHCLCLCAYQRRWRPSCPMNTSPIWKQRTGCWCTLAYRSFLCHADNCRPVRATTGVD